MQRLTRDSVSEADIKRIVEICNQPKVKIWVTGRYATGKDGGYTEYDAKKFVETADGGWSKKTSFSYLIRDEAGQIVGTAGLRSPKGAEAEIGYWADTSEGQGGYMTNAVSALCDLARQAGYARLNAFAMPRNSSSRGVLERNGFENQGLTPYHLASASRAVDALKYAKTLT